MGNNHSLRFSGEEKLDIQSIFNNINNNFTYEFWVKPEDKHRPVSEANSGISGTLAQRYVIVPGYSNDPNHAGVGVSVGTNGVSVFEHTQEHLPAVLVFKTLISDWTHIAIVYEEKIPKLYVNGEFIKHGMKSKKQKVFASGIFGADDSYGQYKGLLRDLRIWNHARTQQQIKDNMNENLSGLEIGLFGNWKFEQKTRYIRDSSLQGNHGLLKENVNNHFEKILKGSVASVNLFHYSLVDIIVPIYNALDYVERCIQTIYQNTELPYNLILINDCSTDERVFRYLEQLRLNPKPSHLKQLIIIHNEQNLGFVKSVNKGMSILENHVVLLNSDTEVPPNWTMRLMAPILLSKNIASVTPFSNSATICSFPNIFQNNPLPEGMTVDEIDSVFEKYGSNQPIELPTGVGFCMAMNRNVLKSIGFFDDQNFGKGYGEENDWCMRALHAGYKNVMIPNLYVYHKHGMSFDEDRNNSEQLRLKNGNILNQLYPDYLLRVNKFFTDDPVKPIRDVLKSTISTKNKKGILFITHSWGGGTEYTQSIRIKNLINKASCIRLILDYYTKKLIIQDLNQGNSFTMNVNELTHQTFNNLLRLFNIELICIDQLVSYPVFKLIELIRISEVDYVYYIHDFYSVCPSLNLINSLAVYCNAETDVSKCQNCIATLYPGTDIENWRTTFYSFLKNAREVIAPSKNTRNLILKYYPDLDISVENHQKVNTVQYTFNPEFALQPEINIAFVGLLTNVKGSQIIFDLLEHIRRENLPINIKVIGKIYGRYVYENYYLSEDRKLEVTGPYNNKEISNLLVKHKISVAIISTVCPETYCWTASEAMWSGYPLITFNLGAPADRVRQLDGGWIAEDMNSMSILKVLKDLHNSRQEILEKADNLKKAYWDS